MTRKQKKSLYRILVASAMLVVLNLAPLPDLVRIPLYLATYFVIGYDILKKALRGLINGRLLDESFLMAVATVGAIALAFMEKSGDLNEAVAVMLFFQIGELFESVAVGKSRKSISALMDIRPDYANIEVDGELVRVDPEEVTVGSIIAVCPGERVPLDGIVLEGSSSLNTSALTGESVPRDVAVGDDIVSGCVNMTGLIKISVTKPFAESTVSKILELVENAGSRKSKSEAFISKFAAVYTPSVCGCALALAVLPPVVNLILGGSPDVKTWIYRALTFLVVSCPCALVISIPLTFFAGLGGAGREGILIKGSNYLETFSKVKTVVFDKTGTLTKGVFRVTEVHPINLGENELLELAAHAECASSHPVSGSIREAFGGETDRSRVTDISEIGGHGVIATVDGKRVCAGNGRLMEKEGIEYIPCTGAGTVVHVAVEGFYAGYILVSDIIKEDSKEALAVLKKSGVAKTVMLTGDSEKAAKAVAAEVGVDEAHWELLPGDKVTIVEKLLEQCSKGEKLAFAGDGINDAPVLTRADIGVAMGALGSDAAIEAADVVLMDDDLMKLAKGIKISRKCLRIVYENIAMALIIKFSCLALCAFGYANMWLAIFADVGVMVLAVLNAIRALK